MRDVSTPLGMTQSRSACGRGDTPRSPHVYWADEEQRSAFRGEASFH